MPRRAIAVLLTLLSGQSFAAAPASQPATATAPASASAPVAGVWYRPSGIRVHAISPDPLKTRAASGLKDFDLLLNEAAHRAPLGERGLLRDLLPVNERLVKP